MTGDDRIRALLDRAEIGDLKSRYLRCLDEKDWHGLHQVLHPDAGLDHPQIGSHVGACAVVEAVRARIGVRVTIHHGHNEEIELTGRDTAVGRWALHSVSFDPRHGPGAATIGYGTYRDEFRRTENGWRIHAVLLRHGYKGERDAARP